MSQLPSKARNHRSALSRLCWSAHEVVFLLSWLAARTSAVKSQCMLRLRVASRAYDASSASSSAVYLWFLYNRILTTSPTYPIQCASADGAFVCFSTHEGSYLPRRIGRNLYARIFGTGKTDLWDTVVIETSNERTAMQKNASQRLRASDREHKEQQKQDQTGICMASSEKRDRSEPSEVSEVRISGT